MICTDPPLPIWYLDQINFAPTAAEKIAQPRSWERKPSTPFITRPKSRKLWKRFRTSFNSMQAQRAHTGGIALVEVELLTEINNSGNAGFLRGVKRLRLEFSGPEGFPPRNRSFVETKWELENRQKHRKHALTSVDHISTQDEDDATDLSDHEKTVPDEEFECMRDGSPSPSDDKEGPRYHESSIDSYKQPLQAPESPTTDKCEDEAVGPDVLETNVDKSWKCGELSNLRDKIKPQDAMLVRSAFWVNSLDPEDAEFLSEFLSRAQAKRAANAAMMPDDSDQALDDEVMAGSPVVPPRRALEEIDKNSPTAQQLPWSVSFESDTLVDVPKSPLAEEIQTTSKSEDENQLPPPGCRRSARTKVQKSTQRSLRSAVSNPIPVKTVNGAEFFFIQRTAAQELAVVTRRNTQRNKGKAQPPKQALLSLAKQQKPKESNAAESSDANDQAPSLRRSPRKKTATKQVKWKEEVEYSGPRSEEQQCLGETATAITSQSKKPKKLAIASQGKSKIVVSQEENNDGSTNEPLPSTPGPQARRVALKSMSSTLPPTASGNASELTTSQSATIRPKPVGTPVPRKKLNLFADFEPPKPSNTKSKPSMKSGIKPPNSSSVASVTKKSSSIPKSTAKTSVPVKSGRPGATPMAKRARAKKSA